MSLILSYFNEVLVPSAIYGTFGSTSDSYYTYALLMLGAFAFSVSSLFCRQELERKFSFALNYTYHLAKTYTPFPSYLKHLPRRTTLNEFNTTELGLNIAKYRLNSRRSSKFCQLNKKKETNITAPTI